MDKRQLHEELESCHARGEAEDRYNERRKAVNKINEGMIEIKAWFTKKEEVNCGKIAGKGS